MNSLPVIVAGDWTKIERTYTESLRRLQINKNFTKWRKRVNKRLPELASRVFALRGTGYTGCGSHWSLEKRLGRVIIEINDYDTRDYYHGQNAFTNQINLEVAVEMLYKDVKEAEDSLKDSLR